MLRLLKPKKVQFHPSTVYEDEQHENSPKVKHRLCISDYVLCRISHQQSKSFDHEGSLSHISTKKFYLPYLNHEGGRSENEYAAHWNSCVTLLVVWRGGPGNFSSCWSMASSRLLIYKAGKHGLNSDGICIRWFLRGLLMRWKSLAKLKIWWSAELFFITSLIANDWNLVH